MIVSERPLTGYRVNLSISESDDSTGRGFPAWQVNRVTLQVVSALVGQGAGVVFGHDWREDGVMEAVHAFARQMQSPVPPTPDQAGASGQPLLINTLPWPDAPCLMQEDRERLAATLRVEPVGLPDELGVHAEAARRAGVESAVFRYLRARGLTHLRRKLNTLSDARLCLGGRTGGSQGRYPGVIEEAALALEARMPLYLTGLLGGATRQVIDAIEGGAMPEAFCRPGRLSELFAAPPIRERDAVETVDHVIDREALWASFRRAGVHALAQTNGLSAEENHELFHTPVLDRVIQLLLVAAGRLRARRG